MLFWWFVLAVFWFVVDDDGFLDYVQVLHQFSFVALNQQTASRINLEINAFAMPLSVLNDLAEAMKALVAGSLEVTISSNQVGRTDLTRAGGVSIFDAFPAQAVIYGRNHPCGDKHRDELDVPCYL